MDALAPAESEVAMRDCPAHMAALYRSAKVPMVAGVATEARSVQRRAGEIVFSDGTAEEMIGCVFLLEAGSLDEAARLAALHPTTQIPAGENLGWRLEVRPVHFYEEPARVS